jgi:hypothetical protein
MNISITDDQGNPANGEFYVSSPTYSGAFSVVDGAATLPDYGTGSISFTFIPDDSAAPNAPTIYDIGGTIGFTDPSGGNVTILVQPVAITVYPVAQLQINYFLQQTVIGEDPFTPNVVIPSEPAVLGMLVTNVGGGVANNLTLNTPQPTIVQNEKGLLNNIQIVGTQVGTEQTTPSLDVDLGDVAPGQTADADILLTSTLEGTFTNFTASFTHSDALGGLATSLITSVNTHVLIHAGNFNFQGSTGEIDYLAEDNANPQNLPDTIYFSNGTTAPVNIATNMSSAPAAAPDSYTVTADVTSGWDYIQLPDPGAGYTLSEVIRSDGTVIPVSDMAWTTDRTISSTGASTVDYELHILDDDSTGSYTVYYTPNSAVAPTVAMTSPVDGSITNGNEPTLSANVTDNSGTGLASMQFQYSSDGGDTWVNAGPAQTSGPFNYTFTSPLANGTYEARVTATDNTDDSATSSPVTFTVLTAPVVTPSTADLAADASSLTISGYGFDANPANDSVTFSNGVTGVVTGASLTGLTVSVSGLGSLAAGTALDASVTADGISSGDAVQVATVASVETTTSFGNLSAPTVTYGAASVTISGTLNADAQNVPAGETVEVTLDGATQNAMLDDNDDFSTRFATGTLGVAGYAISFSYGGDANFAAATGSSLLTVGQAIPSLGNLSAPSINYGTASATISGTLNANADGQNVPAGETVQVTLDGATQNATLDDNDDFSATFATPTLGVGSYTISFSYGGDANFATATPATTTFTVNQVPLAVVPSGNSANYTAGASAVYVDPGVTVSSMHPYVTGATVTISAGTLQSGDVLSFTSPAGSGISGSYLGGVLTLSGSATPAQYTAALQSVTFSNPTNSSTTTRDITIQAVDTTDSLTSNSAPDNLIVNAPITITGAYVSGSNWTDTAGTEDFDGYLASHGLGNAADPALGYALKTGVNQTTDLPWVNLNTITISFSGQVSNIGLGSLMLVGGTGSGSVAAPTATGFVSDGNNTYSWTFPSNLGNNKYVFAIATTGSSFGTGTTQVTDASGAGISGTFTTGSSTFPSGNGLAGSTFDFAFSVLPADGTQGGTVNSADAAGAKARLNDNTTNANYNPYIDYYGDGLINSASAAVAAANLNKNQTSITAPAAPSARQAGPVQLALGTTGITTLALGVQETGNSSSKTATMTTVSSVVSASTGSASTPAAPTSASTASTSSTVSTPTQHGQHELNGRHGRHQFAATDEAVSDFDLADLFV